MKKEEEKKSHFHSNNRLAFVLFVEHTNKTAKKMKSNRRWYKTENFEICTNRCRMGRKLIKNSVRKQK